MATPFILAMVDTKQMANYSYISLLTIHRINLLEYDTPPPQHTNHTCLVVLARGFTGYISKVVFLHRYSINPTPISPFPTQSTLHPASNSNTLYECGKTVGSFSAHYKWRMGSLYHVGGELYLPDPGSCGLDPGHLAWARTVQPLLKRLHARDLSSK